MSGRAQQRGVALMTALILMALAAVLAVAIGSRSGMSARRGAAMFGVEQSLLYAEGAEALAAFVLRQDRASGSQDTPAEAWNKPYGPVEIAPETALEAQLYDESGKFNLNSLVDNSGNIDATAVAQFKELLTSKAVQIEDYWAERLADWIDRDDQSVSQGGEDGLYAAQTPPSLTANLPITTISELLQLPEFGPERYAKLAPYVTALPIGTKLNVCTAPGAVLDALWSAAASQPTTQWQDVDSKRGKQCFPTVSDFKTASGLTTPQQQLVEGRIAENTDYFRLRTFISIGSTRFALYSLMYRDGQGTRPILRTFGTD